MNNRLRGYLNIFAAAFFWGFSATVADFLFRHDIDPLLVVESRVIISGAALIIFFLMTNRHTLRINLADLVDFFLLGIIGIAGANYTYYMTIQKTSVAFAILMQYTAPVLVALYMLVTKKEKISRTKTSAIILALAGCTIMLGLFDSKIHVGSFSAFLGISSAVCFAFFNIYTKLAIKRYSVWTAITYTLMAAGIFWIALDLFFHPTPAVHGMSEFAALALFSIISVLVPYFFYFVGLKYLLPSTAVIVSTLEPVVAITTAFIVLNEGLSILRAAGGLLIVSAVILLEVHRE